MADFVNIKLTFYGDVSELKKQILDEDGDIDFNKIIPQPDYFEAEPEILSREQLSWRLKNWNTKWNVMDPEWIDEKNLRFQTAWTVPVPVIEELSEMSNGSLIVAYIASEFGEEFHGAVFKDGKLIGTTSPVKAVTEETMKLSSEITGISVEELRRSLREDNAEAMYDFECELKNLSGGLGKFERKGL